MLIHMILEWIAVRAEFERATLSSGDVGYEVLF
jgi:hypothetical protein